ncbi:MAG: hypothetical protein EZS28_012547 [Streblomastix strix]|uniref:Serine-threonine/tyrosine-protein kinase catalytic domain-containing protein n=1 Tax=Streblomastix strix TaxID=222440 RepID=A0A5J4WBD3_9EUKA|nr:MAG: hypothetical protein EZS28_012547 [Streblomastix strix]
MSLNTPEINQESVPSTTKPAQTLLQGLSQAYDASRAILTPARQIPGIVQKMKTSFIARTQLEYNSHVAQMQGLKKLVSEKFTKKEKIEDNQQNEQSFISSTIANKDDTSAEQKEKENIQTIEQQTQQIKSQHLTYGLSAKDPFKRVKVNGQDTLFNCLHIERKRIENPFEILSNIIIGLKYLQLIEDERQHSGIKEQQNINTTLIPNNNSSQDTNQLKNESQSQQQPESLNESLSNVAHPLFGDFSSYRIMFDDNDSPVIFLGNIPGFDQNKYVWQEIERRMKDIELKQSLKQKQSMVGQLKTQFQSVSDNVSGSLKSQFKWMKKSFQINSQQQQQPSSPLNSQQQSESISQPIPATIPIQQSSLQTIDDIDQRFNKLDFDIDSSYGGGYEMIRWRSPEYFGLNEKWEELIINNLNNNNNQLSNSIDQNLNPTESNLVFSIGMILYEIITVEIPFSEFDAITASNQLMNEQRPYLSEFQSTVIGDLIESCWQQDPKQRISLNDLYDIVMSISKIWNIDQQQLQSSTDTNQTESNQISLNLQQSNESLLKKLVKYLSQRQYKKISALRQKSQSGTLQTKSSSIKPQQSNSMLKRKNNNNETVNQNNQNKVKESTLIVNSELNDQNEDKEAEQASDQRLEDQQELNEEEELRDIEQEDEYIFDDEMDDLKRMSDEEEDD